MFNNQMIYGYPSYGKPPIPFKNGIHFNWKNILNNTQKTLNVLNQAVPLFYQIKPIYNNAKTMFKVAHIINSPSSSNTTSEKKENTEQNNPIFFL